MSKLRILTAAFGLALAVPALGASGLDQRAAIRAESAGIAPTAPAPAPAGRCAPTAASCCCAAPRDPDGAQPGAAAGGERREGLRDFQEQQFLRDTWTNS